MASTGQQPSSETWSALDGSRSAHALKVSSVAFAPKDLPFEIVTIIVDHLYELLHNERARQPGDTQSKARLIACALMSRSWADAVRRVTFRELSLTTERLRDLPIYVNHATCSLVETVKFNPEYMRQDIIGEGPWELRLQDDIEFTRHLVELLKALKQWPRRNHERGLTLSVAACSSSDQYLDLRLKYGFMPPDLEAPIVTQLVISRARGCRSISPPTISTLISHLPSLRVLQVDVPDRDGGDNYSGGRSIHREVFANSIYTWPITLEHVELNFGGDKPGHGLFHASHWGSDLSLVPRDHLSHALFSMSRNLVTLSINHVTIDLETFFDAANTAPTLWPRLQVLNLLILPLNAHGTWYHNGPLALNRGALSSTALRPLRTRVAPNADAMRVIYTSAAQAIKRMPQLETMTIKLHMSESHYRKPRVDGGDGETDLGILCHEFQYQRRGRRLPEQPSVGFSGTTGSGLTVRWTSSPIYEPDNEVVRACRDIAITKEEGILIESFEQTEHGPLRVAVY